MFCPIFFHKQTTRSTNTFFSVVNTISLLQAFFGLMPRPKRSLGITSVTVALALLPGFYKVVCVYRLDQDLRWVIRSVRTSASAVEAFSLIGSKNRLKAKYS